MHGDSCEHKKSGLSCLVCPTRMDSVFCDLNRDELLELDRVKVTNVYKKGQMLFHEGSPALGIYCVFDGQIKILKNTENGKEVINRIAKGGETLGLRGILTGKEHPASAKVMQDATVCFIERRFFQDLIHKSPELSTKVLYKLAEEVKRLEKHIEDLTTKDVKQRLICLLLSFAQSHGVKKSAKSPQTFLDVKVTRAEMASMIGTSPETVIRILSDLNAQDLIQLEGKTIAIGNCEDLAEELGMDV